MEAPCLTEQHAIVPMADEKREVCGSTSNCREDEIGQHSEIFMLSSYGAEFYRTLIMSRMLFSLSQLQLVDEGRTLLLCLIMQSITAEI